MVIRNYRARDGGCGDNDEDDIYDEGSGIALEVVPPYHRNFDPVRCY